MTNQDQTFHEEQPLTSVHIALSEATQASKAEMAAMVPVTVKMHENVKDIASDICKTNGTNLSEFLRKCCEGLIRDYRK